MISNIIFLTLINMDLRFDKIMTWLLYIIENYNKINIRTKNDYLIVLIYL